MQSPIIIGNNNVVAPGLLDHFDRIKHQPEELTASMRKIGRVVNDGDTTSTIDLTAGPDGGGFHLKLWDPNAAVRVEVDAGLPLGTSIYDFIRQAQETQEAITLKNLSGVRVYVDGPLKAEMAGPSDVVIEQQPIGPTITGALIVEGTEARIDNLVFEGFRFPDGHVWLSNKRQADALLHVWIDYISPEDGDGHQPSDDGGKEGAPGSDGLRIQYNRAEGWTLSQMLVVHQFMRALSKPCVLQLFNYTTHKPMLRGRVRGLLDIDPHLDRLMAALGTIQDAFLHLTFVPPATLTSADVKLIGELEQIITTGHIEGAVKELSLTIALAARDVEALPTDGVIEGLVIQQWCDANLWGTSVPLGEVHTGCPRMRTRRCVKQLKEEACRLSPLENIAIELMLASPGDATASQRFVRFAR